MYYAKNVMVTKVITLTPHHTIEEAIQEFLDKDISGAPVVDDENKLVGIISRFQLLETIYSPELKKMQVSDLMTSQVITVMPNTLLSDVVSLLVYNRFGRVPVVEKNQLVGLISRVDLLRYVMEHGDEVHQFILSSQAGYDEPLRFH